MKLFLILTLQIIIQISFSKKITNKKIRRLFIDPDFINNITPFYQQRINYKPIIPNILKDLNNIELNDGDESKSLDDENKFKELFPETYGLRSTQIKQGKTNFDIHRKLRVGIVFLGGNAPGGHNVITGLYDALKEANPENELIGYIGGEGNTFLRDFLPIRVMDDEIINAYRNSGGYDLLNSEKIKEDEFPRVLNALDCANFTSFVVVGGDDSNTLSALITEHFHQNNATHITVIGVPATTHGNLKNKKIETTIGFDTAAKTFSQLVGNIQRDCMSSRKYWHFIRIKGRSASHLVLEVALNTHPTWAIISEEVKAKNMTVYQLANQIADLVEKRSKNGFNFGVLLLPEGILELLEDIHTLVGELNYFLIGELKNISDFESQISFVKNDLSKNSLKLFNFLSEKTQKDLINSRNAHNRIDIFMLEPEKILAEIVNTILIERKSKVPFNPVYHSFNHEGISAFPSNFDATYAYNLGRLSMILSAGGKTGQIALFSNLNKFAEDWIPEGFPIINLMDIEEKKHENVPVIKKAFVDLDGKPFKYYESHRDEWSEGDDKFSFPGAIQYYGSRELCDQPSKTLLLEKS